MDAKYKREVAENFAFQVSADPFMRSLIADAAGALIDKIREETIEECAKVADEEFAFCERQLQKARADSRPDLGWVSRKAGAKEIAESISTMAKHDD